MIPSLCGIAGALSISNVAALRAPRLILMPEGKNVFRHPACNVRYVASQCSGKALHTLPEVLRQLTSQFENTPLVEL